MSIILSLLILELSWAEEQINSVKNKSHTICITKDQSPIYVEPLQPQKAKNNSLVLEAYHSFKNNGWEWKNLGSTRQGPVLDKRWEDFEIFYGHLHRFTSVKSLSFSVYGSVEIQFRMDDVFALERYSISQMDASLWHHYTIITKNQNTYIFEIFLNNPQSLIQKTSVANLTLVELVVKTNIKTFWKIHNYTYWHSETISSAPTHLTISSEADRCRMIYVSLCKHCCLHFNEKHICGTNGTASHQMYSLVWQKLKTDSAKSLQFIRNTTDNRFYGHWSIDIRRCPRFSNEGSFIYESFSDPTYNINSTCKLLNNWTDGTFTKAKQSVKYDHMFDCNVGFLGNECNISCKNLLGSERKYCERHLICQGDQCYCAWGFEGSFCKNPCQPGYWGLSCKNKCSLNCFENCSRTTGFCEDEDVSSITKISEMWWIIPSVVTSLILTIVIIGLLIYHYHRLKCREEMAKLMENQQITGASSNPHFHVLFSWDSRGAYFFPFLERIFSGRSTNNRHTV